MAENAFSRHPLRLLAPEAIERLHTATLELLDSTGVRVDSDEALDLLAGIGVRCDRDRRRAFPSADDIRRALITVRTAYTLHGRNPAAPSILPVNAHHTYALCGGAALRLFAEGAYTTVTREDLIDTTVLHEQLPHVDVLINAVEPPDADQATLYPLLAAHLFCYSSKPLLLQVGGREDLRTILRMGALVAGDAGRLTEQPLFMTGINSEPPLRLSREGAEVLIDAARAGVPVSLGDYPVMGATGPRHIAAAVVQRTATVLTGLILTQAARPGCIYDFACHAGSCDLASGDAITMSPAVLQVVTASVQLGRHYGLRTHSLACTEARAPDVQAAGERAAALMAAFTSGATFVHHSTCCMAGMELADHAHSVIDNELIGMAKAFAAGVPMDGLDEALAAVREVATDPQYDGLYFLGHPHTAGQCRDGSGASTLFATGSLSRWLAGERRTVMQKATAFAQAALARRVEFVSPALKQELFALAKCKA